MYQSIRSTNYLGQHSNNINNSFNSNINNNNNRNNFSSISFNNIHNNNYINNNYNRNNPNSINNIHNNNIFNNKNNNIFNNNNINNNKSLSISQTFNPRTETIQIKKSLKKSTKKDEFKKKKELEKIKKEKELEEQIKDHLKCYICLGNIQKPRMCPYCKRNCCEECINKWLEDHNFCGICKHRISRIDMIEIPFLDKMSNFIMHKIDDQEKNKLNTKKEELNRKNNDKVPKNNNGPIKIFDLSNKNKKNNNANNPNTYNNYKKKYNTINNPININANNQINNNINNQINNNINNLFEVDETSEIIGEEEDICQEHGNNIEFYCLECKKYYCGQCLIFFGTEANKHKNHFIIKANKINDPKIKEAEMEYKKLPETKNKIENLIGKCNLKLKENEIKKYEVIKIMNYIKNLYTKKIDEDCKNIQNSLKSVNTLKKNYENNKNTIFYQLNNLVSQNGNQNQQYMQILQDFINLNNNIKSQKDKEKIIVEKPNNSPKLFLENFQTDFKEFIIPTLPNGRLNEGKELVNMRIDTIQNYRCRIIFRHSQNIIRIIFSIIISEDIDSLNFPKFYPYIVFKKKKYGLEFINLYENTSIKKISYNNNNNNNNINYLKYEQTNYIELDSKQFLFLCDEQKRLCFKVYITKSFYK